MMDILSFLLFGAIVGWVTGLLMRGRGFGLVKNVVIGVLGASFGGILTRILGIQAYGPAGGFLIAVVGSASLLLLLGSIQRRSLE